MRARTDLRNSLSAKTARTSELTSSWPIPAAESIPLSHDSGISARPASRSCASAFTRRHCGASRSRLPPPGSAPRPASIHCDAATASVCSASQSFTPISRCMSTSLAKRSRLSSTRNERVSEAISSSATSPQARASLRSMSSTLAMARGNAHGPAASAPASEKPLAASSMEAISASWFWAASARASSASRRRGADAATSFATAASPHAARRTAASMTAQCAANAQSFEKSISQRAAPPDAATRAIIRARGMSRHASAQSTKASRADVAPFAAAAAASAMHASAAAAAAIAPSETENAGHSGIADAYAH
mmetsp:Transcript_5779/g.22860  ORF Transcript_5779/g.22860 Transcript_5779/m.22860 type:complete len:308 (-) Transcript_5779:550-1473(-)